MSGFLHHLASMALGAKPGGAARLSLPPRFGGLPAARAPLIEDVALAFAPEPAPLESFSQMETAERDMVRSVDAPARARQPMAISRDNAPPLRPPGRMAVEHQLVNHTEVPMPIHPPQRPVPPKAPPPLGARNPLVRTPAIAPPPAAVPAPAKHQISYSPVATRAPNPSLPLSEAVLAGRTAAAREQAPVIHVTIDRIDVRAPAPPQAAAAQRRARPEPVVSLSEYLRGGGGGRG